MLGAALAAVVTAAPVGATTLTVHDLGTVMNDSVNFTPVNTSAGMNTDIFEFELPTTVRQRLALDFWTGVGPTDGNIQS